MDGDLSAELQHRVRSAADDDIKLSIQGGGSKAFYGREPQGEPLAIGAHRGIINYQPSELVLTARAGTPLAEIEALLAAHNQMLPFEPPHFGPGATLGGTIACGLSGPRRPYTGSARDFVLGVRCLNGKGEMLRFGGEVMKNVAGFDASRLMVGAQGTLGVLLDVSLKVLPLPECERTLAFETGAADALARMNHWAKEPLPVSGACHDGARLYLRLSGAEASVRAATARLGGDTETDTGFWHSVREHTHPFFRDESPLWRLSLPPATPSMTFSKQWFIDWSGAQRWVKTILPANILHETAQRAGGHATRFRDGRHRHAFFHPLPAPVLALHRQLKDAFDPRGILNPGRLYREF